MYIQIYLYILFFAQKRCELYLSQKLLFAACEWRLKEFQNLTMKTNERKLLVSRRANMRALVPMT